MPDVPLHLSPAIAARVRAAAERQAAQRLARAPAPAAAVQAAVKDEPSPAHSLPASAPANLNAGADAPSTNPLQEPPRTEAPSALDDKAVCCLLREARELNDLEEAQANEVRRVVLTLPCMECGSDSDSVLYIQAYEKAYEELQSSTSWLPEQSAVRDLVLTELEVAEAVALVEQLNNQASHTSDPNGQSTTYGNGWGTSESREVLALDRLAQVVRDLRQVDAELIQSVKVAEQRLTRAQELHTGLTQVAEGINQRQAFLARKQAPALDAGAQRTYVCFSVVVWTEVY